MGHDRSDDTRIGSARLDALVSDVIETRRRVAELQAREAQLLAEAVDLALERTEARRALRRPTDHDMPLREISAELAAAMRLSDRTVQARMGDATTLVSRFAATFAAWSSGRIDAGHVSAIVDAGAAIADDGIRAEHERMLLDAATTESPARLRPLARAVAARLDPASEVESQRRGEGARRVRVVDLDDGLAGVRADLPAALAYAIKDRLTQMARTVRDQAPPADAGTDAGRTGDPRTLDQLRADVFADLLLAGAPAAHGDGDALGAIRGHVQVTVPALALAGVTSEPALLEGYGPIDAGMARGLAAVAPGWDRVITDPHTGAPLAVDRYRPGQALRRFLRARDEHCRFPGCRMPVWRCDIDHTVDAAQGGATSADNLAHFCRRHHTLKHATTWTVRQAGDGVLEWRSPTGRAYRDRPAAHVRFVPTDPATWHPPRPDGDPPPF